MSAFAFLSERDCRIEAVPLQARIGAITLDLESDYGIDCWHGLDGLDALIRLLHDEQVPLTVFVEGRLLERIPDRIRSLASHAEVQLHCYDHRMDGDTPATVHRSCALYQDVLGRPAEGYRAHTFRLDGNLYKALIAEGIQWDSSVLPARMGHGANPAAVWRSGSHGFSLDGGRLVEIPVAVLRYLPVPFTHAYHVLGRTALFSLAMQIGRLPSLCVYDMHMVDLYRVPCLKSSPLSGMLKALYRISWWGRGSDTFPELKRSIQMMRNRGYRLTTLGSIFREIVSRAEHGQIRADG